MSDTTSGDSRLKTYLIAGGVVASGLFIYFRYFAEPKELGSRSKRELVEDGVILEHDAYLIDGREKSVEFYWIPFVAAISTDKYPIKKLDPITVPSYIYNFDNAGLVRTLRYFKEKAVENKYKAFEIDDSGKIMTPIKTDKDDIRYTSTLANYDLLLSAFRGTADQAAKNREKRSPITGLYTAFRGAATN